MYRRLPYDNAPYFPLSIFIGRTYKHIETYRNVCNVYVKDNTINKNNSYSWGCASIHRSARRKSIAAPVYVTNPLHNRKLGERWHLRRSVLRCVITRYYYQSLTMSSTLGFCMRSWQAAASFLLMSIYSCESFIDMAKPRRTRLRRHNKLGTRAECIDDRWRQANATIYSRM